MRKLHLRSDPEAVPEVIYLVTLAGFPNYGDELITHTWLQYLARVRPHAQVVVDCPTPGQASLLHAGTHPNAVFVDTLWQLTLFAAEDDNDLDWNWAADTATTLGPAPRLAEGVDLFIRASSAHLVGGGFVNSVWPHHISVVTAMAELKKRHGARIYASGQGLIPALTGPHLDALHSAATEFDIFDVRDASSHTIISDVPGRSFTLDDAWLATTPPTAEQHDGVTLCLQSDLTETFRWRSRIGADALAHAVGDILDAWEVPGDAITVVEGIPGLDSDVPALLGDRLDGCTTIPFLDLWRNGFGSALGNTWISTRFHPHLVAAASGASGVAIAARPDYYGTKHQSLIDSGSRWSVLSSDSDAIPERPTAGGFDPAASAHARGVKNQLAQSIYPRR